MGLEDAEILSQGLVPSCKERKASVEKTSKKPSRLFLDTWLQPIMYTGALGHFDAPAPNMDHTGKSLPPSPNPGHHRVHPKVMMKSARFLIMGHSQRTPQLHQEMEGRWSKALFLDYRTALIVYSCHLFFFISSASVRSIPFLSFTEPISSHHFSY